MPLLNQQDIDIEKQRLEILEKVVDKASEIHKNLLDQVNALKDVRKEQLNVYSLEEKINNILEERKQIQKDEQDLGSKLQTQAQDVYKTITDGFKARRDQDTAQRAINKLTNDLNKALLDQNTTHADIAAINAQIAREQQSLLAIQQKEEALSKILLGNFQGLNVAQDAQGNILDENLNSLIQQYLQAAKLNDEVETQKANGDTVLKNLINQKLVLDAQLTSWQKTKQYVLFISEKIDKFKKIEAVGDSVKFINTQLDKVGISFKSILNNVLEYGKTLTDAAKQLGISVDGVRALADSYEETAMRATAVNSSANAAFLTTKNQLVAQQELNAALGTSGLVTEKARVDQIVLTKQMGLQADEAAKIYQLGLLNKTSADAVSKTVAQQVINLKKSTGIQLNLKSVLQDVSKVSAQISAQYGSNPEKIAEAVVKAKELGLTIEQTANMSEKLLDFQSSIENELKAELLTGKALNLEQARYLALMGDTAGAAKEMRDQIGGLAEYQELNVIQQKSLAEAIGMSREELAESLKQQELLRGSAWATQDAFQEAIKNADTEQEKAELLAQIKQSDNVEQLMQQYQQISAQEKFNQAVEKLKEMVGSLVDGPLGSMLDGLSNAVTAASTLKGIFVAIGAIMVGNLARGIAGFIAQLAIAKTAAAGTAAASLATASAITLGVGIAAVVAGLAAGIYALNSATGESVSVPSASGGGVSTPTPTTPTSGTSGTRVAQAQPIQVNLQADGVTIQKWTDTSNRSSSTGAVA